MSPDNYSKNPFVQRLLKADSGFSQAFPSLAQFMFRQPADFRGLTMFLGDSADVVVGLRAFDSDGSPTICWSSGEDVLIALVNLDKAVGEGRFRVDTKALNGSSVVPPKS